MVRRLAGRLPAMKTRRDNPSVADDHADGFHTVAQLTVCPACVTQDALANDFARVVVDGVKGALVEALAAPEPELATELNPADVVGGHEEEPAPFTEPAAAAPVDTTPPAIPPVDVPPTLATDGSGILVPEHVGAEEPAADLTAAEPTDPTAAEASNA